MVTPVMWNEYYLCEEIEESLSLLHHYNGDAKVIAGGTDLMIEMENTPNHVPALIDITRISELQKVTHHRDWNGRKES